jgi:hypothetical protein
MVPGTYQLFLNNVENLVDYSLKHKLLAVFKLVKKFIKRRLK